MSVLWTRLGREIKLNASCPNNQSLEKNLNYRDLKGVRGLQVIATILMISERQVELCNITSFCPKDCAIQRLAAMRTEAQLKVLHRMFPNNLY